MLPSLTPAVSRTSLPPAVSSAARRKHREPAHLLHGLLEEEDGRAAALADRGRAGPWALPGRARGAGAPARRRRWPSESGVALRARELAVELSGEGVVTSEALLLALLRDGSRRCRPARPRGAGPGPAWRNCWQPQPARSCRWRTTVHLADLTEQVDLARILDAGFNRAREALRVVEDYCRFVPRRRLPDAAS